MTLAHSLLVIDDDVVFCQLVKRGLERNGYSVVSAHDEKTALENASIFKPDFILLDLRLGDASGLQLIEPLLKIRKDSQILVLTGYASLTTAVMAIKLGAINYLAKPVDVPAIVNALAGSESNGLHKKKIDESTPTSLKRLEWEHIQRVLHENGGNISATARQLNMHRRTLQRKLQKKPVE